MHSSLVVLIVEHSNTRPHGAGAAGWAINEFGPRFRIVEPSTVRFNYNYSMLRLQGP
jgi:hypothetical protein